LIFLMGFYAPLDIRRMSEIVHREDGQQATQVAGRPPLLAS
jgi:hypothetical protein